MSPSRSIQFHHEAASEALAAYRWYRTRSVRAAHRFRVELRATLRLLSELPSAWPPYEAGTRVCRVKAFPYRVIYRTVESGLQVVAVAHMSREPAYWVDREGRERPDE